MGAVARGDAVGAPKAVVGVPRDAGADPNLPRADGIYNPLADAFAAAAERRAVADAGRCDGRGARTASSLLPARRGERLRVGLRRRRRGGGPWRPR